MTQTTAPPATETIDLYREVHKGLRKALFTLTEQAGTLSDDAHENDAGFTTLFGRIEMMLTTHHAHEDSDLLRNLIDQHAASSVQTINAAHDSSERSLARLSALITEREAGAANSVDVYDATVAFTTDYLAHMNVEEHQVMPALQRHASPEELFEIQMAIRTSVPPPDMVVFLGYMLPAMTVSERVAMLGGMKMGAPPEIFEMFWAAAAGCLTAGELAAVAEEVGQR